MKRSWYLYITWDENGDQNTHSVESWKCRTEEEMKSELDDLLNLYPKAVYAMYYQMEDIF